MREAVNEWGLPPDPPLVSDNASNMTVAAEEFGSSLHVGCLAHTFNLACGKALKITSVSHLLARMRRVVAYFHRSTVANAILKDKQKLLQLPEHKLLIDVATRWNSALDMISRYLEQQPAIYAALTSKELRGREKDLGTLSERDIASAEELVLVLTPLKIATTALCEESVPTLSMIMPLQHRLLNYIMKEKDDDPPLIKQVKKAVVEDLSTRYQDICTRKALTVATLLDPRFKSTPFLSDKDRLDAYHELTVQAVFSLNACKLKETPDPQVPHTTAEPEPPALPSFPDDDEIDDLHVPSPAKKMRQETEKSDAGKPSHPSAMSCLFGDTYQISVQEPKSHQDICEAEISQYKKEPPINASENPLTWWSHHSDRYPSLSTMAKKYLCIPATSVPAERVFSTAGDVVTAQRSQLKSEHVDRLIFLKKNWKP